jgi:N-methylhydantoinase B
MTPEHLSKEQDIALKPGDRVRVQTPGGGGYGDPMKRDPLAVSEDVRLGRYSMEEAKAEFGVSITPDFHIDIAATKANRTTLPSV